MTRTISSTALTAALVSANLCWGVAARADYEPHKYTEPGSGRVLEYYLYVPEGYDEAQKYPLLVLLHAAGQPEDLPRSLSKGWSGSFLDDGDDQKYPSFFLIPVSQTNSSGWGDGRSDAEKFEGRLTIVVLKELVSSGRYNIDADRLYVTGPSMGGRGTWDMIEKNPGLFAAAVPIAAPGLDEPEQVIHENIWAINGENDSTVQDNRETIAGIRASGGNPIYTELANHGHDSWRSIYPSDAFMAWVYAQRRGVPWWNVSKIPEVSEPLTPGQVVVSGPSSPTGGSGGVGAGGAAAGNGGVSNGGALGGDTSAAGAPSGGLFGQAGGDASRSGSGGAPTGAPTSGGVPGIAGVASGSALSPPATSDAEGCSVSRGSASAHCWWLLGLAVLPALRRRAR
jgi:hypothetical protein